MRGFEWSGLRPGGSDRECRLARYLKALIILGVRRTTCPEARIWVNPAPAPAHGRFPVRGFCLIIIILLIILDRWKAQRPTFEPSRSAPQISMRPAAHCSKKMKKQDLQSGLISLIWFRFLERERSSAW
jgi:hypothetical protein